MKARTMIFVCVLLGSAAAVQTPAAQTRVEVTRPGMSFLGVNVAEIDSNRAKALNLKDEHGVEITKVEDDSPAAKAGLKQNDVVLEYNGQRVEGTEQFIRMVHETPAGRQVKLLINRGGSPQTLTATIASRRTGSVYVGPGEIHMPTIRIPEIQIPDIPRSMMSWRSTTLGVEAESLEGQLADYFGVKDGVLIRSVMKDSAAEKAGLKAGDVILRVDGTRVSTPREVTSAIRSRSKNTLPILIIRQRKEMTVNVTVDQERSDREPARPRAVRARGTRL